MAVFKLFVNLILRVTMFFYCDTLAELIVDDEDVCFARFQRHCLIESSKHLFHLVMFKPVFLILVTEFDQRNNRFIVQILEVIIQGAPLDLSAELVQIFLNRFPLQLVCEDSKSRLVSANGFGQLRELRL